MLVCASATRFAIVIVRTASQKIIGIQISEKPPNAPNRKRSNTAKAAVLVAAAMKPVTLVGAPVYTSGTHWWNGTTAILNARPISTSAMPTHSNRLSGLTQRGASDPTHVERAGGAVEQRHAVDHESR